MKFSKWRGLGSDFIITLLDKNDDADYSLRAPYVCGKRSGAGADGFVTLKPAGSGIYEMKAYSAAGKETPLCGNAIRCAGLFLKKNGLIKNEPCRLETSEGIIIPEILGERWVRLDMGEPLITSDDVSGPAKPILKIPGTRSFEVLFHGRNTVIFAQDAKTTADKLVKNGSKLKNAAAPGERMILAEVLSRRLVRIKVWRAFDGIIPDCGVGSCAAAAAGIRQGLLDDNVSALLDDGELQIDYDLDSNRVRMTGQAAEICEGTFSNLG